MKLECAPRIGKIVFAVRKKGTPGESTWWVATTDSTRPWHAHLGNRSAPSRSAEQLSYFAYELHVPSTFSGHSACDTKDTSQRFYLAVLHAARVRFGHTLQHDPNGRPRTLIRASEGRGNPAADMPWVSRFVEWGLQGIVRCRCWGVAVKVRHGFIQHSTHGKGCPTLVRAIITLLAVCCRRDADGNANVCQHPLCRSASAQVDYSMP